MQKVNEQLVHQRPIEPKDHSLIYNSLLRSFEAHGIASYRADKDSFFGCYKKEVEKFLNRCYGICAVNPGDHDQIYAYILFEHTNFFQGIYPHRPAPILHYVYVKAAFRNMGFASWLIDSMLSACKATGNEKLGPIIITHLTEHFDAYLQPKGRFTYNPYLLGELHGSSETATD